MAGDTDPPGLGPFRLHVIANAHIDPVWIWDWHEGMHEVLQTFASALDRLDENPNLIFTASSAAFYQWVEDVDPSLFDRIRRRVAEGRWVITGGQWVEPDCNLPSGESMCRQFLYGQRFLAQRFGRTATVGYNIDAFGHAASLPQIMARSGITAYVMMRPEEHEKALPGRLFLWEGVDGTQIPTYRIPFGYSTGGGDEEIEVLSRRSAELLAECRHRGLPLMLFFGVGDHGGGPTKTALGALDGIIAAEGGDVGFSSPHAYFNAISELGATAAPAGQPPWLPVVAGELQWHAVGCFSTLSAVKRANAQAERALMTAEVMAVLCRAATGSELGAGPRIEEAWRAVLFNQFHDVLAGTCARPAYLQLEQFAGQALALADVVTTRAAHCIVQQIDTRPPSGEAGAVPVVVFNPLSWDARMAVRLIHPFGAACDETGRSTPVQQLASGEMTYSRTGALFQADVPAMGYRVYWLRAGAVADGAQSPAVRAGATELSNGLVRVAIDVETGAIRSLVDEGTGREWLGPGGIVPVVVADESDTWSHGVSRFDGAETPTALVSATMVESGPVRATVRLTFRHRQSTVVEDVSVYDGRRFVELRFQVDWHQRHELLKVAADLCVDHPASTAGVGYGHVDRPASGHEEVMQHWVDVHRAGRLGGVAFTADWKYGYDLLGPRLRLTALRSACFADHGQGWDDGDEIGYPVTDQGHQEFSVRVHPHDGSWADAGVPRLAEEHLLCPPTVLDTWHAGPLAAAASYVTVRSGTVAVAVLKRAEDDDGTVLRLWETDGEPTIARIDLGMGERSWQGPMGGHEVKTLYFPDDVRSPVAREIDIPELEVAALRALREREPWTG